MNIKKEMQKTFPRHKIHHEEETLSTDEEYSILYDKGKKLCLQLTSNVYFINAWDGETLFSFFPAFTKAEKAIAFMKRIYLYTKWLRRNGTMDIQKELQKAFPHHKIHHEEETQSKDERYFILYDKGKKLSLYLHRDSYSVNAWNGKTLFIFSVFSSIKEAISSMQNIYLYTKWLNT